MAQGFSAGAAKSNGRVCFWTSAREGWVGENNMGNEKLASGSY